MRPKDHNACLWMAAACVTALVYPFMPTTPRYYPLEHLWRWENVAGAASMGWYGKAAWSLAAGAVAAALLAFVLPHLTERAARSLQKALVTTLYLAYPFAVTLMILHEFVWKQH